jgi:hypothetical protein
VPKALMLLRRLDGLFGLAGLAGGGSLQRFHAILIIGAC